MYVDGMHKWTCKPVASQRKLSYPNYFGKKSKIAKRVSDCVICEFG